MSFSTEVDRWLRHSPLALAQPWIRAHVPWLHRALIATRDVVLPYRSKYGLDRYQHRAIERFYRFAPDLSGMVLEIGSDVDGRVLKELSSRGCRRMVGLNIDINPAAHKGRGAPGAPSYEVIKGDVRRLPIGDNSASAILSITAFEHIHDFDQALREMHRVLKPGGILYADFGPIWSCSIGHHVFAIVDGVEARHWKPGKNPVPHFAHFLMSPQQLRATVMEKEWVFPKLADEIVRWIYVGDGINRIFYEDYVKFFEASPFKIRHLAPVHEYVPPDIQATLEAKFPGYKEFGVRMAEVVLEKD